MPIDTNLRHPLYTEYLAEWLANIDFAEMKRATLRDGTYIPRWGGEQREAKVQYDNRKRWSAQVDHAPELLDTRMTELWREEPIRTFGESPFEKQIDAFLVNVDGAGTKINAFMKRLTEGVLINGVDVLIDKTATLVDPISLADEDAIPFATPFGPLKRLDWATDHAGKYLWVLYSLGVSPRTVPTLADDFVERLVLYTREGWTLITENFDSGETLELSGEHNMGIVPVVQVYQGHSIHDDQQAIATSIMSKLAPLSQYMLDLLSQQQLDLFMTVAFYVVTGVAPDQVPKEFGASYIMGISDPAGDMKPVNPNVAHITEKRKTMEWLQLVQLRKGKVMGLNATMSGRAQSGVQFALESSPLHSELSQTASVLEDSEMDIVRLAISRQEGRLIPTDELGYEVKYPHTFTLQSMQALADEGKALSEINGIEEVPEILQAHFRKIANQITKPGSDQNKAIIAAIDKFTSFGVNNEPVNE